MKQSAEEGVQDVTGKALWLIIVYFSSGQKQTWENTSEKGRKREKTKHNSRLMQRPLHNMYRALLS